MHGTLLWEMEPGSGSYYLTLGNSACDAGYTLRIIARVWTLTLAPRVASDLRRVRY